MLDKANAINVEIKLKPDGGKRYTYTFICSHTGCDNRIKSRKDSLNNASGLCKSHAQRKKPFESIYNQIYRDDRGFISALSYEDFLSFTSNDACHYCLTKIVWNPYSTVNNEFISRAYYLDRKDSSLGYSKSNCVVCCTKCNRAKNADYTYEEWYGMTAYFRCKT
jgi:hypothetical protein